MHGVNILFPRRVRAIGFATSLLPKKVFIAQHSYAMLCVDAIGGDLPSWHDG